MSNGHEEQDRPIRKEARAPDGRVSGRYAPASRAEGAAEAASAAGRAGEAAAARRRLDALGGADDEAILARAAETGDADADVDVVYGAEAELARQLTEGPMEGEAPEQEAVTRLSPRWEIRIQSAYDPVAEETAQYRKLAKEADDRYDKR